MMYLSCGFILIVILCFHYTKGETATNVYHGVFIELPNGILRGRDNEYYYSYESIPYAEPPLRELRLEAPRPYTRKWENVFNATKKPKACLQWDQFEASTDKLVGREDCLTVSVYKPKVAIDEKRLPVFVLLHGGAFMFGSVNDMQHEQVMHSAHVIVVKVSYRLGPLGFLSTEDDVMPGNYGLKDQLLAMQWIKQNIAHFGGDPASILVLGFSSGGAALNLHMLQPDFSNYAKAAVSFSGTALNTWAIMHNARAHAYALAKSVNCTNVDIKKCLKHKPASAIVRSVRHFLVFGYNPFTTFGPVIESATVQGAILTQPPEQLMRVGNFAQIPWLLSYTAQDGGYNAAELLQKSPRGEELIEELNDRWYDLAPYVLFYKDAMSSIEDIDDYSRVLKQRYLANKDFSAQTYADVQRMYTDVLFKNGVEQAVQLCSRHSRSAIYAYVYDNPADRGIATYLANRNDISFGTTHGDDFFLIFHNEVRNKNLRPDELEISKNFIKMLEDFVQNSTELVYGSCRFVNNVGSNELQLMVIAREGCANKNVTCFP